MTVLFTDKRLKFPEGFLWGAATASHQVEGGIENNDWAQAARAGKVPVCGRACDHYNLFERDFDIAVSLGHNAHKISLEWSRIEPRDGEFDREEIEHYKQVLAALKRRNLKAFVCIWHFTLPDWFVKRGGFFAPDAEKIFVRYAGKVASELGDKIDFLITINEPNIYASNTHLRGLWPPFIKNPFSYLRLLNGLVRCHRAAFSEIKKVAPALPVGISKNNIYFHSNKNPIHQFSTAYIKWFWNRRFLNKIDEHLDFIGLNYYFHKGWGTHGNHEKTDFGWDICPEGIFHVLLELERYRKPIYIIENGLADAADTRRANFIRDHVTYIHKAIEQEIDVRGYLHWSLLDNYEWAEGFEKRFGLVEVDYRTHERRIRKSALYFKEVCQSNAV